MVKTSVIQKDQINELQIKPSSSSSNSGSSFCKYKGVRKRKWGKYVSEIRLPNSRERIWLGSHDTAEKAARAFDAALFCLRGPNAKFNFPDSPPDIDSGRSMTPAEIQIAAAKFANYDSRSDSFSLSSSSDHLIVDVVDSPCASSVSGNQIENEVTEIPLDIDKGILDQFMSLETEGNNNVPDFGLFPGFDDFPADYFVPPVPTHTDYYWQDNYTDDFSSQTSFLWNF